MIISYICITLCRYCIEKWINFYNTISAEGYTYIRNYHINKDLTIDASWVDLSFSYLHEFPKYIRFNKINTDFSCDITDYENFKLCGPKEVVNDLTFYVGGRANFNKKDIKKICKVGGEIEGIG